MSGRNSFIRSSACPHHRRRAQAVTATARSRRRLTQAQRPDVDRIDHLPPALALRQQPAAVDAAGRCRHSQPGVARPDEAPHLSTTAGKAASPAAPQAGSITGMQAGSITGIK
jgi:hypothetical protein